jgi:hypothetical protein
MPSKPVFLTRSEIEWLAGARKISKTYEYKMKSTIRKKLDNLLKTELPLIQNSGLYPENLTVFGKTLTVFGKVDNLINSSNLQIQCIAKYGGPEGTNLIFHVGRN